MPTESKFYIYDIPGVAGPTLNLYDAREVYAHDPVGFAEWELRRAKAWANLIAQNWPKAQAMKSRETYETQKTAHSGAVNYVIACDGRMKRARRRVSRKAGKKKKTSVDGSMT